MGKNKLNQGYRVLFFLFLFLIPAFIVNAAKPEEVVVVANLNSTDSVQLARFYSEQRAIPDSNIIYLDTSTLEEIEQNEFAKTIWNPLRKELLNRSLMEGRLSKHQDKLSRLDYVPTAVFFKYLVTCKGIPLKIKNRKLPQSDYQNIQKIFRTTRASVDSELSLIVGTNAKMLSSVPNPFFRVQSLNRLDYTNAISVSRLDGPTLQSAKNIVASSIEAEKNPFIQGRVYIDQYPKYDHGNLWLESAYQQLKNFGYESELETSKHHWSISDRCDRPAIYLGWYKNAASGPAVSKSISIPKGAIAAHIHSYSGASLLSGQSWVSQLIKNGFAVTFGNVYEPYLELTTRPDLFIQSLLQGKAVGDAILYSNQVLSWQNLTIADPLYTPFPNTISWENLENALKLGDIEEYAAITLLNRKADEDRELAKELLIQYFIKNPTIPVAYKILTEYNEMISPSISRSLVEYLISIEKPEIEYIPLYFELIKKELFRFSDIMRLKHNFSSQIFTWPDLLNKKYEQILSKYREQS